MSQCLYNFTPTLPLPASLLIPYTCCPPSSPLNLPPLSAPPPSRPLSRSLFWTDLSTSVSLALLAVALMIDIALVLHESLYTGRCYYVGRGCTSPPHPTPLTSFPHPEMGKPTCPPCTALSTFPPAGRPLCGENRQGSYQYWVHEPVLHSEQ